MTNHYANVRGVITGVETGSSSTYLSDEDNSFVFLFEDGSGILQEQESIGSLYRINDNINFTGSKDDIGVRDSAGVVSALTRGPIEAILIDDPGTGFFGSFYVGIAIPVENSSNILIISRLSLLTIVS